MRRRSNTERNKQYGDSQLHIGGYINGQCNTSLIVDPSCGCQWLSIGDEVAGNAGDGSGISHVIILTDQDRII